MKIVRSVHRLPFEREKIPSTWRIGFVPTMGALHRGHLALVERSKKENDVTVVSIFVNPIQFGPTEDFARYPRPWRRDVRLLTQAKVDLLFSPDKTDLVSSSDLTRIKVSPLNSFLCGDPKRRGPRHFDGVATIVAKLFHLVRPHRAYFGLKDFQQVRIIEQMIHDLNFNIQLVKCPTVREADGLALSSRNQYLSTMERREAARLYAALQHGRKLLTSFPKINVKKIQKEMIRKLSTIPNAKIDYVEIVNPSTLTSVQAFDGPVLIAAALYLGQTRLIDNLVVSPHAKKISH